MVAYTGFDYEKGMRWLMEKLPLEQKKPVLYHSLRVGSYLFYGGYSYQLQIAGLLHDAIEDTEITYEDIAKAFDEHIAGIVLANSKNSNLPKEEILEDIVKKCSAHSEDAMIVKMCDVYDNFKYYLSINNISELGRCKNLAILIQKHLPAEYKNSIFTKSNEIISYCDQL